MNKIPLRISASSPISSLANQRGAISVAAVLSMTALLGMGAMTVDVGNVMVARNDVQNAADAAALRGAGLLYPQGSSSPDFSAMNNNPSGPVYTTANLNTPIGKQDTLTVNADYWKNLNPSAPPNDANDAAVRVTYTKQVNLFFAGIIGMNSMNVTATSTAIVQNSSVLGAGGTHLPFAIPQCVINQYWGNSTDQIEVGPTHTCSSTCVTAQLTNFTQEPDDGHFDGSEAVALSGNSTDLHVNDQIYLQPQDYGSGLNNNNNNRQGKATPNDSLFFHVQTARLDSGARYPAPTAPSHSGLLRTVMLVSPSSAVFTPYSRPRFIRTDSGNGNGNPYMTINDCSAAGNHSCEYSIVPIVNLAASNSLGGGGLETITGFVCVHVLSASTGTVTVTFSTGCVSNTTSSVGTQTAYYGVSSPPRLAQ